MNKVFLGLSGSASIESSIKLARQHYYEENPETLRNIIISRDRSYHGNTLGALAASEFLSRQAPYKALFADNVAHVSSCYPYRQQLEGESNADYVAKKAYELDKKFEEIGPEKVMAFILEPVSGAALGCASAVPGYLKAMKEICHKHGALIIFDEVMCGLGRTGVYHAWQKEGVAPDILVIGKGLAAGYHPVGAILAAPHVWGSLKSKEFIHGFTYDAMPVGAVAALKVQEYIKDNNLLDNVKKQGDYLGQELRTNLSDHPQVGDIRGVGLF